MRTCQDIMFTVLDKLKAKLPLCPIKHHAMKKHWGSGGREQRIPKPGTT